MWAPPALNAVGKGKAALSAVYSLTQICVLPGCCCGPAFDTAEPQYQSYQLLLSEVSSFTARLNHNAYRPLLRPAGTPSVSFSASQQCLLHELAQV